MSTVLYYSILFYSLKFKWLNRFEVTTLNIKTIQPFKYLNECKNIKIKKL